jgi:hypothetical protein
MAAMKNPCDTLLDVHTDYKNCNDIMIGKNLYEKELSQLYIINLKDRVFACKAISRMNAIDIASSSDEFDELMSNESLSHGRPVSKYQIPNMNVIRVRPYHRGWWLGAGDSGNGGSSGNGGNGTDNYIYVSMTNGKPTVYNGESMILDLASSKGMLHKVRVYDYGGQTENRLVV